MGTVGDLGVAGADEPQRLTARSGAPGSGGTRGRARGRRSPIPGRADGRPGAASSSTAATAGSSSGSGPATPVALSPSAASSVPAIPARATAPTSATPSIGASASSGSSPGSAWGSASSSTSSAAAATGSRHATHPRHPRPHARPPRRPGPRRRPPARRVRDDLGADLRRHQGGRAATAAPATAIAGAFRTSAVRCSKTTASSCPSHDLRPAVGDRDPAGDGSLASVRAVGVLGGTLLPALVGPDDGMGRWVLRLHEGSLRGNGRSGSRAAGRRRSRPRTARPGPRTRPARRRAGRHPPCPRWPWAAARHVKAGGRAADVRLDGGRLPGRRCHPGPRRGGS